MVRIAWKCKKGNSSTNRVMVELFPFFAIRTISILRRPHVVFQPPEHGKLLSASREVYGKVKYILSRVPNMGGGWQGHCFLSLLLEVLKCRFYKINKYLLVDFVK